MKTSSGLTYTGHGRIAICRMYLQFPAGFKAYRPLAPGDWFKKWKKKRDYSYPEYYERYQKQLDQLDPELVFEELKALAAPHEPVLLCWEEPPLHRYNWCHRALVARWFWDTIGLEVRERYYGLHKSPNWKRVPPHTTGKAKPKAVAPAKARQLEAHA